MKKTKIIGWYQIFTGIFAILLLIINIFGQFNLFVFPLFLIICLLILYVIFSGYKLINEPLSGIKFSVFAQLIQTIGFTFPGFTYIFSTPSFLSIYINQAGTNYRLLNEIISLNIRFDKNIDFWGLVIYPIPIVLIVILMIEGFKIESEEKEKREMLLTGNE